MVHPITGVMHVQGCAKVWREQVSPAGIGLYGTADRAETPSAGTRATESHTDIWLAIFSGKAPNGGSFTMDN